MASKSSMRNPLQIAQTPNTHSFGFGFDFSSGSPARGPRARRADGARSDFERARR